MRPLLGRITPIKDILSVQFLFVPMMIMGIVMLCSAPELLPKRLKNREERTTQKGVVALSGLLFIVSFVVAGLNYRYHWHTLPTILPYIASVIFLIGYAMYAEVMRENAYLSRTIEVQKGQKVIDTGLYGIVRHPMYLATLLMFLPMPLILQSFWGLIPFALYPVIIVIRIVNEEKVLTECLEGYAEYKKRVKYRLITFIW